MKEQDAWLPIALCSNHKPIKLSQKRKNITILPKIPYASSCKGLEKRHKDIQMYDMLQCKDFRFNHPSPCSYRALFPASWKACHGKALITVLFHPQRHNFYIYEKRTPYLRKFCLKFLWECCGYNFQLLSLLHWKGGIRQVHGALTSSFVIHCARHIGKELQ